MREFLFSYAQFWGNLGEFSFPIYNIYFKSVARTENDEIKT